jgi:hypothetical protein
MANVTPATEHPRATPVVGLLAEGIIPNFEHIVAAWNAGRVPVLFFALDFGHGHDVWPRELGWKGQRVQLARMTKSQVFRYANALVWLCPNGQAARWLRRTRGPHRLLVLCDGGRRACLNFTPEAGFTSEPGA